MNTLFISTNHKQMFGAKLGKYSFEREAGPNRNFEIKLIVAEDLDEMRNFVGKTYIAGEGDRVYSFDNLQSFTLTRFKPPELMGYEGRAIVIDPDIFALPGGNIEELFNLELKNYDLAACRRERGNEWESSVMLLDTSKLRHWKLGQILDDLAEKRITQMDVMELRKEKNILELSWVWNSLDKIDEDSKILHTTNRLTQPWKTGLKIDFIQKPMQKMFGIIKREPIHKLLGKYPTHYLPHPNKQVVDFFFNLTKQALEDRAISKQDIVNEIKNKNLRPDFLEVLSQY